MLSASSPAPAAAAALAVLVLCLGTAACTTAAPTRDAPAGDEPSESAPRDSTELPRDSTELPRDSTELPLESIELPRGFSIALVARVPNARSLVLSPSGVLFVGSRAGDSVRAVIDEDGDHRADEVVTIASGLRMPNGVAWKDGDLYVAEVSRVLRFHDIEKAVETLRGGGKRPEPEVLHDDFPTDGHHGWKYIAFDPEGVLHVPVGAPCNVCDEEAPYASITRLVERPDGTWTHEVVARGVRNTVGFDWHPETGELWFTDNGRDMLGDDIPPDELNRARRTGTHFGYPHCHGRDVLDPVFGDEGDCDRYTAPARELGPHVAALGMTFYDGDMFPPDYHGDVFIAEHGSWNRTEKIGYRVTRVPIDGSEATGYEVFASGWLRPDGSAWGRPVDVIVDGEGALLVSDDHAGAIYRITHGAGAP